MGNRILLGAGLVLVASLGWTAAARSVADEMETRARHFLASLDADQKARALIAFGEEERFNWHFIPRERMGLAYGDFTPAQRRLADLLLASGMSHDGISKAFGIIFLEQILFEREGRAIRDADRYHVTLFDEPSDSGAWGWRFEGHHLSLNFTLLDGEVIATSPAFMGTNPAIAGEGKYEGVEVLAAEQNLGRELLGMFGGAARERVVFESEAPRDILTGSDRLADPGEPLGVAFADMTGEQQEKLLQLLRVYTDRLRPDLAEAEFSKVEAAGLDHIHFAWAGSAEPGEPHYYRIHGPTFLIEYDNTQNDANHVHSVWRDLTGDFGRDLLAEHYAASHSHGEELFIATRPE